MAKAAPFNVFIDHVDPMLEQRIGNELREEHGVHGLKILGRTAIEAAEQDIRLAVRQTNPHQLLFSYSDAEGAEYSDTVERDENNVVAALSQFAVRSIIIPLHEQSSRNDYQELSAHSGIRPRLESDPSPWIVKNPFVEDLFRRYPKYGNLVRFLCNERGLFLKVGNHPNQRAYWNSTLNGGLPVFKKADPIHEGTFMLHDMFHFIPVDPIMGSGHVDDGHKAAYVAHRMLSEASTLVLADMVAVADARLDQTGYDVSKRKIFPVYEDIVKAQGRQPEIDKLLAANAYFCFTGDPEGFRQLGAKDETLEQYQAKYDAIFKDDFMWNLQNFETMLAERESTPRFSEYYEWLEVNTPFPTMQQHEKVMLPDSEGLDIARLLSIFRADFTSALNFQQPLDDAKRQALAFQKYLAGQRVVFARFGNYVEPEPLMEQFDAEYRDISMESDPADISHSGQLANDAVDAYINQLESRGHLLPHEAALYRFSAPLYPVKFVNYERKKQEVSAKLSETMSSFMHVNQKQLHRVLEAALA